MNANCEETRNDSFDAVVNFCNSLVVSGAVDAANLRSFVFAEGLDEKWLGRVIDRKTLAELIKLSEKTYINVAFEGGEAETLVIDGPIFKRRIEILDAEIDWDVSSGTYNILDARLVDK